MTSVEAAELLKKSLVSIITRTEAQKLAEAIANDPSLAKFIDIPLTKVIFCIHIIFIFITYISKSLYVLICLKIQSLSAHCIIRSRNLQISV